MVLKDLLTTGYVLLVRLIQERVEKIDEGILEHALMVELGFQTRIVELLHYILLESDVGSGEFDQIPGERAEDLPLPICIGEMVYEVLEVTVGHPEFLKGVLERISHDQPSLRATQ